jgi:hypothetical protein
LGAAVLAGAAVVPIFSFQNLLRRNAPVSMFPAIAVRKLFVNAFTKGR